MLSQWQSGNKLTRPQGNHNARFIVKNTVALTVSYDFLPVEPGDGRRARLLSGGAGRTMLANMHIPALMIVVLTTVMMATASRAQTIIYVDENARGLQNGSSWCQAYTTLHEALDQATNGNTIRVADRPDNITGTEDDDLHLLPASPCVNTGDPAFVPESVATDLAGAPRLQGCRVYMGAYESNVAQLVGDFDADGTIDLADYGFLQLCYAQATGSPEWLDTCLCVFDISENADVDLDDLAEFVGSITGP